MAAVVERKRRDGSCAFQVRWRQGESWQSETFGAKRAAARFALDVEEAGHRWPRGWTPGIGYEAAEPAPSAISFAEFAGQYLATRTAVSSYQLTRYRSAVTRLASHFELVEAIDDQRVAAWIGAMLDAGSAPKTIANYHGLLFAICAYAVRKELLPQNPCADTQLPRRNAFDDEGEPITCFLEVSEFELIAEAMCAWEHYEWRPTGGRGVRRPRATVAQTGIGFRQDRDFITVAVHTGLRWGEITALRVGDVDLAQRQLTVKRAWKRDGVGAWVIGPPKTKRSRRTISLAPALAELLAPHLAGRERTEYVFRNGDGGPLRQPSFYEDRWQRAVRLARQNGLAKTPRFHDLRHTHVAWLVAANTPLPKIQQRLGHESIRTTIDVYGGLPRECDDQVDGVVEALLTSRFRVEGSGGTV
jgi:integrase